MRTITPEEIEKIEIYECDPMSIKIYYKNGDFDFWKATITSTMYGIVPELTNIECIRGYNTPILGH